MAYDIMFPRCEEIALRKKWLCALWFASIIQRIPGKPGTRVSKKGLVTVGRWYPSISSISLSWQFFSVHEGSSQCHLSFDIFRSVSSLFWQWVALSSNISCQWPLLFWHLFSVSSLTFSKTSLLSVISFLASRALRLTALCVISTSQCLLTALLCGSRNLSSSVALTSQRQPLHDIYSSLLTFSMSAPFWHLALGCQNLPKGFLFWTSFDSDSKHR